MKILFTGGSSFTGMWFIQELVNQGHSVTAAIRGQQKSYSGIKKIRIEKLQKICHVVFDCSFGGKNFMDLIKSQSQWDILCHHAADVTDYKSPYFNFSKALENNTYNIANVFEQLKKAQCQHILLTGSVFEQNEGICSGSNNAISPYGLSKGLTSDVFSHFCNKERLAFGKFVIPNPFGPYEEERFTTYLIKEWLQRRTAAVNTPSYIRDNIPVTLLAECYCCFLETFVLQNENKKINPSYRPQSQGAFTQKFSEEMKNRLHLPCDYQCKLQTEFQEPAMRINSDAIEKVNSWDEHTFWDHLAEFYTTTYLSTEK